MIISRAPYRVSFFGGGTDYAEWYKQHGGVFLSSAIDHSITIVLRKKPPFGKQPFRVVWRELEEVGSVGEIQHPFVRAALEKRKIKSGLDVVYFGDLPHGAGLGSSSCFGVAFLNGLNAMEGVESNSYDLAREVYEIEHDHLGETVGIQDQFASAFGGFNLGKISTCGRVSLERVAVSGQRLNEMNDRLVFVFTGISRHASNVAASKVANFSQREAVLKNMTEMTYRARDILVQDEPLDEFASLLHENWLLKRSLSSSVSNDQIDEMYAYAQQNGALGGKLLGAGGGGFMAFMAKEGECERLKTAFKDYTVVPIQLNGTPPEIDQRFPQKHSDVYDIMWTEREQEMLNGDQS